MWDFNIVILQESELCIHLALLSSNYNFILSFYMILQYYNYFFYMVQVTYYHT